MKCVFLILASWLYHVVKKKKATVSLNLIFFFLSAHAKKATKLRVADFVHGVDGLGNQNFPQPNSKPIDQSAAEYLVEQTSLYPGEITLVALGPLTNIALVSFITILLFYSYKQLLLHGSCLLLHSGH